MQWIEEVNKDVKGGRSSFWWPLWNGHKKSIKT
jgi:hypothetical protein